MKQIQAVIRPEKLEPVKDALVALGINGLTVSSVQGFGKQMGYTEVYRGVKIEARLLPKMMITTVVTDSAVAGVLEAIQAAARTGEVATARSPSPLWKIPSGSAPAKPATPPWIELPSPCPGQTRRCLELGRAPASL